jgi:hypothetical protein
MNIFERILIIIVAITLFTMSIIVRSGQIFFVGVVFVTISAIVDDVLTEEKKGW